MRCNSWLVEVAENVNSLNSWQTIILQPLKPFHYLQPLISNKLAPIPNCVIVVFVIQLTFVPFCHQPFCICTGLIKKPLSHFNLLISTTLHLFVVILSTRCVLNNSFSLVIVFIKKKKKLLIVLYFFSIQKLILLSSSLYQENPLLPPACPGHFVFNDLFRFLSNNCPVVVLSVLFIFVLLHT